MELSLRPRSPNTKQIGDRAESVALAYLSSQGLKLVTRNFKCKHGEIDLIMRDDKTLVFVEVRFRSRTDFGGGTESIDHRKQERIRKTAEFYLQKHVEYTRYPSRIDVVAVGPDIKDVNWIPNALG